MTIVFISAWYSDNMGYIENCLPKSLVKMGHEVHVITSTAQVYFNHPFYEKAYQKYLGDPLQPVGKTRIEGVTIHRLPFYQWKSKILLRGLISTIFDIKPDVVTIFEHVSIDTFKLVLTKITLNFKLFTANHAVMSVYPTAKNWAILPFYKKGQISLKSI